MAGTGRDCQTANNAGRTSTLGDAHPQLPPDAAAPSAQGASAATLPVASVPSRLSMSRGRTRPPATPLWMTRRRPSTRRPSGLSPDPRPGGEATTLRAPRSSPPHPAPPCSPSTCPRGRDCGGASASLPAAPRTGGRDVCPCLSSETLRLPVRVRHSVGICAAPRGSVCPEVRPVRTGRPRAAAADCGPQRPGRLQDRPAGPERGARGEPTSQPFGGRGPCTRLGLPRVPQRRFSSRRERPKPFKTPRNGAAQEGGARPTAANAKIHTEEQTLKTKPAENASALEGQCAIQAQRLSPLHGAKSRHSDRTGRAHGVPLSVWSVSSSARLATAQGALMAHRARGPGRRQRGRLNPRAASSADGDASSERPSPGRGQRLWGDSPVPRGRRVRTDVLESHLLRSPSDPSSFLENTTCPAEALRDSATVRRYEPCASTVSGAGHFLCGLPCGHETNGFLLRICVLSV